MSVTEDLAAATKELKETRQRMSVAGGVMSAAMALATVMNCDEAAVWQVVAAKRLIKIAKDFTASTLAAADQLNEELKAINNGKGT